MAKSNTKKVGQKEDKDGNSTDGKDKKEKKVRIDFLIKDAMHQDGDGNLVSAVNEEGLLVAVPKKILSSDQKTVEYAGWDNRRHKPLKKSAFASMAIFLQFQAYVARLSALRLVKLAENKEAKADRLLKFGDEATRKKAEKVIKMREQLAKLEQQLEEEGVKVDDKDSKDSKDSKNTDD